jgi:hypothetical protein
MKSGFRITGSSTLVVPETVNKSVDYELTYLRKRRGIRIFAGAYTFLKALFQTNLRASAVASSALSASRKRVSINAPDSVVLKADRYAVANTSDLKIYQDGFCRQFYRGGADAR